MGVGLVGLPKSSHQSSHGEKHHQDLIVIILGRSFRELPILAQVFWGAVMLFGTFHA